MADKKYFRYKKGRTEIESDSDNIAAIRLAYINAIFYWTIRIMLLAISGGTMVIARNLIKYIETG